MNFIRKLPIPQDIKAQFPLKPEWVKTREEKVEELRRIFRGESNKFVLIIGPCSADNQDAVLAYLEKLARVDEAVRDKLLIIPRIYTNKPRTTGEGYKGMLHQPDPICSEGSSPFGSFTELPFPITALPARTRCCIPKITDTFPTFWLTTQ